MSPKQALDKELVKILKMLGQWLILILLPFGLLQTTLTRLTQVILFILLARLRIRGR